MSRRLCMHAHNDSAESLGPYPLRRALPSHSPKKPGCEVAVTSCCSSAHDCGTGYPITFARTSECWTCGTSSSPTNCTAYGRHSLRQAPGNVQARTRHRGDNAEGVVARTALVIA